MYGGGNGNGYPPSSHGHANSGYGGSADHSTTMIGGPAGGHSLHPSQQGSNTGNPFYAQGEDPSYASSFTHGGAPSMGYDDEAKMPLTEEKFGPAAGYPSSSRHGEYG